MTRIDYHDDPDAPRANSLLPGASAVVTDKHGRILLHRRSNDQLWSIPGVAMEIGETIRDTVTREVKEETGFDIEPESLVGIYSDPNHVAAHSNSEVRQQFPSCFACHLVCGHLTGGDETLGVFLGDDRQTSAFDKVCHAQAYGRVNWHPFDLGWCTVYCDAEVGAAPNSTSNDTIDRDQPLLSARLLRGV